MDVQLIGGIHWELGTFGPSQCHISCSLNWNSTWMAFRLTCTSRRCRCHICIIWKTNFFTFIIYYYYVVLHNIQPTWDTVEARDLRPLALSHFSWIMYICIICCQWEALGARDLRPLAMSHFLYIKLYFYYKLPVSASGHSAHKRAIVWWDALKAQDLWPLTMSHFWQFNLNSILDAEYFQSAWTFHWVASVWIWQLI
jgi:hypothetical protein